MAFFFGDGFDLYAQITDCGGYWDGAFGGTPSLTLASSGRFVGSRGLSGVGTSPTPYLTKTSGQNDTVHHISISYQQTSTLTGTSNGFFVTFYDGATAQCSAAIRSDGAIVLTSGAITGTTLATYTGAVAAISTWYQFEIEVVVNNTTGSIAVRKNGNTSNDFFLGSLNTRASANNYANKIGFGSNWNTANAFADDFLWRSDAASVAWVGDIRCFTRMPASDVSAQFTRSGSVVPVTPYVQGTTSLTSNTTPRYTPFVAPCDGTVGSVIASLSAGATGNLKCSLFGNSGGNTPGAVLGSATTLANPATGSNTLTFGTPVSVTRGTTYWIGFQGDVSLTWNTSTNLGAGTYSNSGAAGSGSPTYTSFPVANQTVTAAVAAIVTVNITPTTLSNAAFVAENATDYAGGYDYSSTVGQSDLYAIAPIGSTPSSIVGVTTRAYAQKSDAGTRILAVQLQSGGSNVQTTGVLNTSWNWIARNDLVDPATGAAWTATGVNNALIGVQVNT